MFNFLAEYLTELQFLKFKLFYVPEKLSSYRADMIGVDSVSIYTCITISFQLLLSNKLKRLYPIEYFLNSK